MGQPIGKKEKADANASLSVIHSASEWPERKNGRSVLWRIVRRSMRSSAANEQSDDGLQRKWNVANRCDRGGKSYDANQKRKHLPGFSVLPGVPGEAAESMFERRGHGQLLKKFGSYPDGRLPSGKKEKADGNVSLSIIHSTSE
ncbi:hypothetical protein PQR57_23505 [Paraburkholderia dipogonis]|uniref:Uncharacterized protein n=1 Tax=Paraburkholderia dipogonis TaxID=1211383 RepID=A0ABW9AXD9_9BURK